MPVVTKEQLKIWFSNFKKPPEGEFWAWIDSFYHKMEGIAISAITGLTEALQKKADLVDGVVPEHQLPFSVVTSEVITLGTVSLTDNVLNLAVHSSGANKVRVKGKTITRTFENNWNTTPIADNGVKVIRGYAVRNEDDFFISEGEELPEFTLPEIPEDALEIFKITMRSSGNVIEQTETGLKYIAEDGWRNILLTEDLTVLPYNFDLKSSYWINSRVANPVIGGIHNGVIDRNDSPTWDGKEFWLFNNTGGDLLLDPENVTAIDDYLFSDKLMPLTIKNNNAVLLKLKDNVIEIMQGGGGASFPVSGNDGDVLIKSGTNALWSNRLNIAENEIDTEVVNRAIADNTLQNQINILGVHNIKITTSASITTNTLSTTNNYDQNGRNVVISNGVNAINLTCEISSDAKFVASYTKIGSAAITFTAGTGATLVQVDGTAILNGAVGSTACLTRDGNNYYLQISNR